jgi:hypothetical protein
MRREYLTSVRDKKIQICPRFSPNSLYSDMAAPSPFVDYFTMRLKNVRGQEGKYRLTPTRSYAELTLN